MPVELYPEQRWMLADYFGGARETLILIPKKNGKTTLMAALALYHLVTTPDAECVIAAASRDQAAIMLRQASGFIRRSPGLQLRMQVKQREIVSRRDGGRIRVLAADADTADGVLPTLALVDELHRHKSPELYGVFADGLGPRDGKLITISTAGDDEASPLGRMRSAAMKMPQVQRQGAYTCARSSDNAYVMHEWALDGSDDRSNMAVVKAANPAPWQSEDALRVRFNSPSTTPWQWARFACGVWMHGEQSAVDPVAWDALRGEARIPRRQPMLVIGMDLGWRIDTTALVPLLPKALDDLVIGDPMILQPPVDEREIVEALLDLADGDHEQVVVPYDRNAGGAQMVQLLERGDHPVQTERAATGLYAGHNLTFVEYSQDNAPMALASVRVDEAIRTKAYTHSGHEVLRSHVLNAIAKPLGGEKWKYDRPTRGGRKPIDGLTSLEFATSVAIAEFEADSGFSGPFIEILA